jgi:hypothetical protein
VPIAAIVVFSGHGFSTTWPPPSAQKPFVPGRSTRYSAIARLAGPRIRKSSALLAIISLVGWPGSLSIGKVKCYVIVLALIAWAFLCVPLTPSTSIGTWTLRTPVDLQLLLP